MASDDWKKELDSIFKKNHEAFVGQYSNEINELLGLSRAEIDELTPDTTDLETYDQLITAVKEASRRNVSNAELADRIRSMGGLALSIAKKSSTLTRILL